MAKIGIIIGSTREGRFADTPVKWLADIVAERDDAEYEIVDLRNYLIPFFHGAPLMYSPATDPEVRRWSSKIAELDGYIFITAEYNHSITGVLKNALDHLLAEGARKPAAFVAYGGVGGARAVEHLRHILAQLQIASLKSAIHIGTVEMMGVLTGGKSLSDHQYLNDGANAMLGDLVWWTNTLKAGRDAASA